MNYYFGSIDIIINKNYVCMYVMGSTGINRSFTWALPGWSGAHPVWLVGNNRSAAGVSVIATIISPRIVPVHPGNLPGWSWALPGVRETAALHIHGDSMFTPQTKENYDA
jgi:hypothetical protein